LRGEGETAPRYPYSVLITAGWIDGTSSHRYLVDSRRLVAAGRPTL
jgi:hypothetical protein